MDELRQAAESMKRSYVANDPEKASDEAHTIHNPVVKDNETVHEGVTPAAAQTQASSPEQKPETTPEPVVNLLRTLNRKPLHLPLRRVINRKHVSEDTQPLITHLIELRKRLLNCIISVIVIFLCLVYFANDIYHLVSAPLIKQLPQGSTMIATDVASPFFTPIGLTFMVSLILSAPVILLSGVGVYRPSAV